MDNKLENEKISKLLLSLALPTIFAQLVSLMYNMADRIYIGRLEYGADAMAGIGISLPLVTLIMAFSHLFGKGGSPLAAIHMGRKDNDSADKILTSSFVMLVCTAVVLTIISVIFKKNILMLFGAGNNTIGYAEDYFGIYCLGTIFVMITIGMNSFINTQGFTKMGMATTLIGCLLNIILDPIFIFGFNMGVKGAALATVISQGVSCVWVIFFLFGKKTLLHIKRKYIKPEFKVVKSILMLGVTPFFMVSTESILQICFNTQLLKFGSDIAISAMTIMTTMFQLIMMPVDGISLGGQPIMSYNYGAKRFGRVKAAFRLILISSFIFTAAATTVIMIFPKFFIKIYTVDPTLTELTARLMPIYLGGGFLVGANSTFQQTYTALGKGKTAFFFAFYRKIILLIPLIFILPHIMPNPLTAVIMAEPISDILTTVTNGIYFRIFMKKNLSEANMKKI